MNLTSPVTLKANVKVETFDVRTGEKLSESRHSNMAVDAGLDLLASFLYGNAPTHITHGAVGTDNTATAAGDTTLNTEVFRDVIAARALGSQSITLQFVLGSTHANGSTLTEAGLFNASSGGTMYARVVTSSVVKTALVSVLYTWTLSFANA